MRLACLAEIVGLMGVGPVSLSSPDGGATPPDTEISPPTDALLRRLIVRSTVADISLSNTGTPLE
jgi:hypothetical protein